MKKPNAIGRRNIRILANLLLGITLWGLSPNTAVCQGLDLEDAASRFSKELEKQHLHSVVVADFDGPGESDTQLGRALAEALLKVFLEKHTKIQAIVRMGLIVTKDRTAILASLQTDPRSSGSEPDFLEGYMAAALAEATHADAVITGRLVRLDKKIQLTLKLWDTHVPPQTTANAELVRIRYFAKLDQRSLRFNVSSSMEGRLADVFPAPQPNSIRIAAGFGYAVPANPHAVAAAEAGKNGVGFPKCIHCPSPTFNPKEGFTKSGGVIFLRVVVAEDGRVTDIRIVKTAGSELTQQAIDAVRDWKFKPAVDRDGRPMAVSLLVEVTFRLLN